jgi:hypothetical protein
MRAERYPTIALSMIEPPGTARNTMSKEFSEEKDETSYTARAMLQQKYMQH